MKLIAETSWFCFPITISPFWPWISYRRTKLWTFSNQFLCWSLCKSQIRAIFNHSRDKSQFRHKTPRPRHLKKVESIPLDELPCDNVSNTASGSDDNVTLDRCIEMFSEAEILQENEFWYCSTCKVRFWTFFQYDINNVKKCHFPLSMSLILTQQCHFLALSILVW